MPQVSQNPVGKHAACLTAPDFSTKLSFELILSKHTRFTYRPGWLCLKLK